MKQKINPKLIIRICCWLLVFGCMVRIFCFSAQPAFKSSATSKDFIEQVFNKFYKNFKNKTASEKEIIVEKAQNIARKGAHFTIYLALGFLVSLALFTYKMNKWLKWLISVGWCALYAASDEWHQTFINGRSGRIKDVGIDTLGGLFGTLLFILLAFIVQKIINVILKKRKLILSSETANNSVEST